MSARYRCGVALLAATMALPAASQDARSIAMDQDYPQSAPSPLPTTRTSEIASTTMGQVGQRRTRETLGRDARIEPMARISSRIQNRVPSRVRNRIDRFYDPQADAPSPFAIADELARTPQPR